MEWQPIETAPKDGTVFMAWVTFLGPTEDGDREIMRWRDGHWVCQEGLSWNDTQVKLWHPILPAPKGIDR